MDFDSRIKKEMSEGIVKAILEDAQYRVIDSGIEKVVRELAHMDPADYAKLDYPEAMRRMPDFTVMTPDQTEKFLVEVKYRAQWNRSLFEEIVDQVKIFGELVLVSINAHPPNEKDYHYPSTYIRCCRVRYQDGQMHVELRSKMKGTHYWLQFDKVWDDVNLWWAMSDLRQVFTRLGDDKLDSSNSLKSAIKALEGILN
ncbi:hypothetical protein ACV229_33070 [Burkholderia sp. MR1-5-21]